MSDQELSKWLRQQRETRFWSRDEMARQLIRAAHAKNDMSVPSVDSLSHNIYRWERGTVGPTERYKLYYSQAFGIPLADFAGGHPEEQASPAPVFTARDVAVIDLMAGAVCIWRRFRNEIGAIRKDEAADIPPVTGAGT